MFGQCVPVSFGSSAVSRAQAASTTEVSPETNRVNGLVRREMQAGKIPGLQLKIVQHHRTVFSGAFGFANIENSVQVTEHTIFHINSMSKAFTGVAAMQLVEEGKLNLDAPLTQCIAGSPTPGVASQSDSFSPTPPAYPRLSTTTFS